MKVGMALFVAVGSIWASTAGAQQMNTLSKADQQIVDVAASSPCAKYEWADGGRAPIGYIKGMALVYAKSFCEAKTGADTAVRVMGQPLKTKNQDALAWYGEDSATNMERLRTIYTLAIGVGMRESSGNTTEGRYKKVKHPTPENAEAGLFQTSHDSFGKDPSLAELFEQYKANLEVCRLSIFMQGVHDKRQPVFGGGVAAEYQAMTKTCPALAAEYAVVMLRVDRTHFGPINTRKAEINPQCRAILEKIETLAVCVQ